MASTAGAHAVSSRVWIKKLDEVCVWAECEVVGTAGDRLRVRMHDGEVKAVAVSTAIPKNPVCEEGADDLAALTHLDEPNVLHNLKLRFSASQIYTWTGRILMAINPWRKIDGLYSAERLNHYCAASADSSCPTPHVFAVADQAYRGMMDDGRRQCILVSGDSGSGKTETTKYLMQQLAAASSLAGGASRDASSAEPSTEQQVLDSNPLLEAFGNAKTLRNNNSSRFGKFLTLQFESDDSTRRPKIGGACIQTYLLEKSRVVRVAAGERNYHIFHQLHQAASCEPGGASPVPDVWHHLDIKGGAFRILGEAIEDTDDHQRFSNMQDALLSIGVAPAEWNDVLHALAGLLHLGNLEFLADTERKGSSDVDTAVLTQMKSASIAARLLACTDEALTASVLSRKVRTVEETVTVNNSREQAETARDSLLKAIYGKIFDWLIERINLSLTRNSCKLKPQGAEHESAGQCELQIGILDIFGFESFGTNGFEQFCINYANEKLQLQFNNFVFKLEQNEYEREKISWTHIDFNDNQPCIDVIESWPGGLLATLDEECKIPRGSDSGFAAKVRATKNPHIQCPKTSMEVFTVLHYAGAVSYNSKGFLERNKVRSFCCTMIELDCSTTSSRTCMSRKILLAPHCLETKIEHGLHPVAANLMITVSVTGLPWQ
jgi:myosin V